jgi:signal transduction histidine kinase
MWPRPTVRLRLTVLYTGLFLAAAGLLLGASYALLDGHLHRTLSTPVADELLAEVREQYVRALVAVTALALLLGWVVAGRALRPLRGIVAAARTVSGDSLDRRIDHRGPDDEIRDLAETFDDMLERLDAAFTSQRRFVANASHELRTPLTVMRTEAEVALADPQVSAQDLRQMASVVGDEVARSEKLIDSLLALARSEAGVVQRDELVDLAELAGTVSGRLRETADARGIALQVRAAPVQVSGERRLLEQLVSNLVQNAVLHNHAGGFADIEVAGAGDEAVVRVENSGPDVPAKAATSLLEPFQRLGGGAPGGPGAGVGLSIVRAVARAHGGGVRLGPRPEGGLVVEVRLPAAATTEADAACVPDPSRDNRGRAAASSRRPRRGPRSRAAPR